MSYPERSDTLWTPQSITSRPGSAAAFDEAANMFHASMSGYDRKVGSRSLPDIQLEALRAFRFVYFATTASANHLHLTKKPYNEADESGVLAELQFSPLNEADLEQVLNHPYTYERSLGLAAIRPVIADTTYDYCGVNAFITGKKKRVVQSRYQVITEHREPAAPGYVAVTGLGARIVQTEAH